MKTPCLLLKTGLVDYRLAYALQKKFLEDKLKSNADDVFILSEHNPVITLGRGFREENLLVPKNNLESRGIMSYEIERGGDATYHGPGQAVGYPVFDLKARGKDLRLFVESMEEALIGAVSDFGIDARRKKGHIGVWAGPNKVASIGVAVKKWVSYHGFSLNICPEMDNFSLINPCGLDYNVMTSMEKILGKKLAVEDVQDRIVFHFERVFNLSFILFEGEIEHA